MSDGHFFTFSLPLLAMPLPEKERLLHIVYHSINRAGQSAKMEESKVLEYARGHKTGPGYRQEPHSQIIRGAITCNVNISNSDYALKHSNRANEFIRTHESKYGASPLVFISTKLFWGCRDNDDPPYRDFCTLCAVNSIIGFKQYPVLIRRSMIIARQLGYKTPKVMEAELANRPDQKSLTVQQLRDTLCRLETRDLFARYQATRRNVYFSTTLDYDALKNAVAELRAKQNKVAIRRSLEPGNQKRTTPEPQENHLKRKVLWDDEKEPLKNEAPKENHSRTTPEPLGEPLK